MTKYAPWLVALAALLWTIDAPFRVFLTEGLSSTTIVLAEHIIIFFLILPIFFKHRHELKNLTLKEWGALAFIGIGGSALATIAFTQAFRYLNPSVVILLQKAQPFIAMLLAVWILKESLPKRFYLWALVGIFGGYLITFPELTISGFSLEGGTMGVVLALLAALFWGGSTVLGRVMLARVTWPFMTALRFMTALVFLLILGAWNGTLSEIATMTGTDWSYVLIIAIIVGFISLFIYYRGLKDTRASVATIAELMFPFAAVIVNWIFLDATLVWQQLLGGAILLLAISQVAGVNYESLKKEAQLPAVS